AGIGMKRQGDAKRVQPVPRPKDALGHGMLFVMEATTKRDNPSVVGLFGLADFPLAVDAISVADMCRIDRALACDDARKRPDPGKVIPILGAGALLLLADGGV